MSTVIIDGHVYVDVHSERRHSYVELPEDDHHEQDQQRDTGAAPTEGTVPF
jgi:hypothetical protein